MMGDLRQPGLPPALPSQNPRDMAGAVRRSAVFLRRHLRLILVCAMLFAGLALVGSQMMDRLYRSSVQLMIAESPNGPVEQDGTSSHVDGQVLVILGDDMLRRVVETANLTEVDHFRSDPLSILGRMNGVLRGLQNPNTAALPDGAPPREVLDAMRHLRDALAVYRQGETNVVKIEALADSPALAHRVATAVAATYLDGEAGIAGTATPDRSGARIISAANVPLAPIGPPVALLVALGFLVGAATGLTAALARGALDARLRTSDQIERLLQLRVLAHLPQLPKGDMIPGIVSAEPLALFSETIASLRHALARKHRADAAPVLLVASTGEYEGKTSIAASLAEAARVAEKNVLLIDGDLRRSELSARHGLLGETGLSDILQGAHWEMQTLRGSGNVDLLPAGVLNDMPLAALDSERLADLLARARAVYDLVVIDGPPVTGVSDCAILSQHSDQILYILRWGQTLRDQALRAVNRLPRDKIAGVVVNCSEAHDEIGMGETYRLHSRDSARGRADPYAKVAFMKDWDRRA